VVDIEPWWTETAEELWRECGFPARPSYGRTYQRFVELEDCIPDFLDVVAAIVKHARRHEPMVGLHVHVDGTEAETHAALVHDCRPGEGCNRPNRRRAGPQRPPRRSTDEVSAERQRQAELPPPEDPSELPGRVRALDLQRKYVRVRVKNCWYRCLDPTAGVRAYISADGKRLQRFWLGFYNQKAIDHYTGAPLVVGVFSANRQEYDLFPELNEMLEHVLGRRPQTVTGDRGYSVKSVFWYLTSRGVSAVMPWRAGWITPIPLDRETHDRDGIPRCKHCGAETIFARFAAKPYPRIWFRCTLGVTPSCRDGRQQSIACSRDPRLLIPLWKTDPIHQLLLRSHERYERVHGHWRQRYRVAGDTLEGRPKRRGIKWQQQRANAALMCEWLRICWRQGWLGSAARNRREPRRFRWQGERGVEALLARRQEALLDIPYGPNAARLGLGPPEPFLSSSQRRE
jgi:hypothetical protein